MQVCVGPLSCDIQRVLRYYTEKQYYCQKDTYLQPKRSGRADIRVTNRQTHTHTHTQDDYRELSLCMSTEA